MAESKELDSVILPDWTMAVKSVSSVKPINQNPSTLIPFTEAMSALFRMYRAFGSNGTTDEVRKLVDAFTTQIIQMHTKTVAESADSLLRVAEFSCPICFEVVEEPHTIRCGHSLCKKCLHKEVVGNQCRVCSYRYNNVDVSDTRPNVLLMSIVDKLCPSHKKITCLRNEGNEFFQQKKPKEALEKYTQAIELGKQ
jgi:hypothetical protein